MPNRAAALTFPYGIIISKNSSSLRALVASYVHLFKNKKQVVKKNIKNKLKQK